MVVFTMKRKFFIPVVFCFFTSVSFALDTKTFTHADILRASITDEGAWGDVLRYHITVKPDFVSKTTVGSNVIGYRVLSHRHPSMQIDLQDTLHIDSIVLDKTQSLTFSKEGNVWHVQVPEQKKSSEHTMAVYFSGKPRIAPRAPWDG